VKACFKAAVGNGWLTIDQFWRATPTELFWLCEARQPVKMYGSMTEAEVRDIYEDAYGQPG
jgi:hypothetical protein